jgi:hypothetical protein
MAPLNIGSHNAWCSSSSRPCHALALGFGRRAVEEMIIVQPATFDTTKITALRERRGFGERDLWELWLLDEAEKVPCGSIRTFLHYLYSEGTRDCEIHKASPLATGSVDITLRGPLADDERNHSLRYRLTRDNLGELREEEKELLVSRLIEHYSPIKEGFNDRWRLARMKHEKEFLLTSLIASAFDDEKGGDPND